MSAPPFELLIEDLTKGPPQAVACVVGAAHEWDALGARLEMPEVDFVNELLVVIARGTCPDGSHALRLEGVDELSPQLACVRYAHTSDGPPADMIVRPIVVAKLPRTGHHLLFARR